MFQTGDDSILADRAASVYYNDYLIVYCTSPFFCLIKRRPLTNAFAMSCSTVAYQSVRSIVWHCSIMLPPPPAPMVCNRPVSSSRQEAKYHREVTRVFNHRDDLQTVVISLINSAIQAVAVYM